MRNRQVHLDFHTSGALKVGEKFSKEQFISQLKNGHLDSITVFSKCHHGWSYHPTTANEMHPGLSFDLLGAQLEACREAGVNAPVYISAGFDEKDYERHPEWRWIHSRDKEEIEELYNETHFHPLCFNTPYLEKLCSQVEEVMEKYNPCGVFLDIIAARVCFCDCCLRDMKKLGLDCDSSEDCQKFAVMTLNKYMDAINASVRKYSDTATIFHNSGHIPKGNHTFINKNTHLELESLPTGGWGYDHFPLSAAYVRTLGDKEYLGMTGKFHQSWGEFGGFKHPNALIYETALSVMNGAGCSIGDQLHSSGEMNPATYSLIGKAYARIEEREPWLNGAENVTDIAVLSVEATSDDREARADIGANRMLLENKLLYNFIDETADISGYKLLILPDNCRISDGMLEKINTFIKNGGKVLASGESIIRDGKFILDTGAVFTGRNEFSPTYFVPLFPTVNGDTSYIMRCDSYKIEARDCEVTALRENPYFNRERERFCSHMHAPNNEEERFPAVVIKDSVAYISWDIFKAYGELGHLCFKEIFTDTVKRLTGDTATVRVSLPDKAVMTLTRQEKEKRSILHLLFAHTTVRGRSTEVIEDTVPLYNVRCEVRYENKPSRVYLAPEKTEIPFTYENGRVIFTVPVVDIHGMAVIED
ncbi:MAG: beta-galactosidase trimerization domain-containing protein [Clostridia bacterium]|nr:beta-galactosidase trimerization domain-containing protein [Clostridia bacterium]